MREIEKIEAEYEGQIRERVRELREKIEQEKRNSQIIVSEEEEEDGSEERRSIKNMKRIESAEKVVSNDIDFSKITRKKFVNNKYKVK
jgi:tetrahydromethanopterin S-methyltransferase subunit A